MLSQQMLPRQVGPLYVTDMQHWDPGQAPNCTGTSTASILAVLLALRRFHLLIQGKHMLIRINNLVVVVYINRQGGIGSCCMSQLSHLFLWSQQHLKSLRATYIPGTLIIQLALSHDRLRSAGSGDSMPRWFY